MFILPYDVIDEITEIIRQENDDRSLYAMSLTSRSMLQLCRRKLFGEMDLLPRSLNDSRVGKLPSYRFFPATSYRRRTVELLAASSPDILANVRRLSITPNKFDEEDRQDTTLCTLLEKFTNLRSLSLVASIMFQYGQQSWTSLPLSYQHSIAQLIHKSPLRSLSFASYTGLSSDILLQLQNLDSLTLRNITFSSQLPAQLPISLVGRSAIAPVQLKELRVTQRIESIMALLNSKSWNGQPIIDPKALRSLIVDPIRENDMTWDPNVFKELSGLKYLVISDNDESRFNYSIDILHNLQTSSLASLFFLRYEIAYSGAP
ncbi:hypothetical protein BDN70DRAFT_935325 [Pholiota conissans]|uniref:Uncharacterized protein n=1 Tax=Pholiota conissans TaxID=109636 RepID=A0A9P5YX11_9AGAR|nr:hypothetical protein BDN70DRAFT_935325 [Pholiota conissans]